MTDKKKVERKAGIGKPMDFAAEREAKVKQGGGQGETGSGCRKPVRHLCKHK